MRTRFLRFVLIATLAFAGTGELGGHVPKISDVRNGAWYEAGLSPGVRAVIFGSDLNRDTIVEVNKQRALVVVYYPALEGVGGDELGVVLPQDLRPGPGEVLVRTAAGSSAPFPVVVNDYAPGLFEGFARSGRLVECFALGDLNVPATAPPGSVVTARAVGLGGATPVVTVGRHHAQIVASVLSSDSGVYDISFRVPPVEGYHAVTIEVGGRKSNERLLPVGRALLHHNSVAPEGTITASDKVDTAIPCGGVLATGTGAGDPRKPPTSLFGTTAVVTDSAGIERRAPLLYVSPRQVNYVVPAKTAVGNATLTITSADGRQFTTTLHVRNAAPHLYAAGPSPAAVVIRVRAGVQTVENIFQNTAIGVVPVPIDLGPESDRLILLLFGTGLRHATRVTATIGSIPSKVHYAGAQNEYPGLDQVNVELPRSLAGLHLAQVEITTDEQVVRVAALTFR